MGTGDSGNNPAGLARSSQKMKRLLLVDDEPAILDLLVKSLALENCNIALARDGQEAWKKLETSTYDCIVMDLKMPRMSGPKLYQCIESLDPNIAKRVIFMTGDTSSPETQEFVKAISNPLFMKPFNIMALRDEVIRVLDGASA